jgi:uncharacterized protein YpiB (UPF0302 family)
MRLFSIVLVILSLTSCHVHKKSQINAQDSTVTPPIQKTETSSKDNTNKEEEPVSHFSIENATNPLRLDFQSAEMTGEMVLENTTDRYNFAFNIRILKDSIIWMQLKKFGLEGARILINKDSMYVIDRIHRSYMKKSWQEIQTQMNAPVDFNILYELIAGNPYYMEMGKDSIRSTENMKIITNRKDSNRISIGINAVFEQMISYMIEDLSKNIYLKMDLADYKLLYDKKKFSYLRDLEIISNNVKLLYINLSFNEVKRNTKFKFPFEIPVGYKPMAP